ncbi:hypothetical protein HMPREF0476_1070 [Kingella kingae ATCC 23330]|uniref:Uncharacterized protein n=1 Tax=Kingella kingae ATCC 23330 TaxID=887327 RepID=F5S787_KINKI|nr:hypothetical protein HMPREF0476_1070 [Kingella kingae ATCC 23330]
MPNVLHTQFAIWLLERRGANRKQPALAYTYRIALAHNHSRDMANFIYVIEQSAFIVQPTMVGKI